MSSGDERANYVFVYGTLKRGGRLHDTLESLGSEFVCEASIQARLYRPSWAFFPAAQPSDSPGDRVHGEVFLLREPQALTILDRVEGVASGLFGRYRVKCLTAAGELGPKVWVYFYGHKVTEAERIWDGVFDDAAEPVEGVLE